MSSIATLNQSGGTPRQMGGGVDLQTIFAILKNKAQQKTGRSSQDCFRFLNEREDGYVSRAECQRFFKGFGIPQPHVVADRAFNALSEQRGPSGNHAGVDLKKFINVFGPAVQPGRYHCSPAMNKLTGRGGATPMPKTARSYRDDPVLEGAAVGGARRSIGPGSVFEGSDWHGSSKYGGASDALSDTSWSAHIVPSKYQTRNPINMTYIDSIQEESPRRALGNRMTMRPRPPTQNPSHDLPRGRANRGPSSSFYNHCGVLTHDMCQTGGGSVAESMMAEPPE